MTAWFSLNNKFLISNTYLFFSLNLINNILKNGRRIKLKLNVIEIIYDIDSKKKVD